MAPLPSEIVRGWFDQLRAGYRRLEDYHRSSGIRIPYPAFIGLVVLFAAMVAWILAAVFGFGMIIVGLAFVSLASMAMIIPISLRQGRIDAVEVSLPDVLRHMSAVLRAGGTTEAALEEVSKGDYGPLALELQDALKQLREGRDFDNVMTDMARTSGSILFLRIVNIVVDAKRAGAGLADIMTSIAEDTRDMLRIKRERLSKTTMQVVILYSSAIALGPFIFGFALTIVSYIGGGSGGAMTALNPEEADASIKMAQNLDMLTNLLTVFIGVQVTLTMMMVGVIREGKALKYIFRIPMFVLAALLVFEGGKWVSRSITGGSFG